MGGLLVIDELIEVQDVRKITDPLRGIYEIYLNSMKKKKWQHVTCWTWKHWIFTNYAQKSSWTLIQERDEHGRNLEKGLHHCWWNLRTKIHRVRLPSLTFWVPEPTFQVGLSIGVTNVDTTCGKLISKNNHFVLNLVIFLH